MLPSVGELPLLGQRTARLAARTAQSTEGPDRPKSRTHLGDESEEGDGDLDRDQSGACHEGEQISHHEQQRIAHESEMFHVEAIHTNPGVFLKLPREHSNGFHRHRLQRWDKLANFEPTALDPVTPKLSELGGPRFEEGEGRPPPPRPGTGWWWESRGWPP
eukprot:9388086-Pyramimonas_sp.AAC.1